MNIANCASVIEISRP